MKIKNYKILIQIIVLPILFLFSCIDETWPELADSDSNLLVVEGRISNLPGPYTVKLSRSQPLDSLPDSDNEGLDFNPYSNANVSIIDELGNNETLTEVEPGIYQTSEGGIQGIVGRGYKLSITTTDGIVYESDFEQIPEPVEIDTIYASEITVDGTTPGFQFYLSSALNPGQDNFYLWELTETYEYRIPYKPTHKFEGVYTNAYYDTQGVFHPGDPGTTTPYNIPRLIEPLDTDVCWLTQKLPSNPYKGSTKHLSEARIKDYPLHFIHYGHISLRVRYSLLASQFAVSEKVYRYFSELEEQNSYDENELYTKQPYQIRGNIYNVNDPNDVALGIFYASGASEKRYFAPSDPRPRNKQEYGVVYCGSLPSVYNDGVTSIDYILDFLESIEGNSSAWPVYFGEAYIFQLDYMPWDWPVWFVAYSNDCIDCRTKGGVNVKPDFW